MKNYSGAVIILILLSLIGFGILQYLGKTGQKSEDIKIAVISDSELGMVSISPDRKMVNTIKVDGQTPVWVNGGPGWYQTNRIKKLLSQEKKETEYKNIMFYNFGFLADKVIVVKNFDQWNDYSVLLPIIGLKNWFWYYFHKGDLIVKQEKIDTDLNKASGLLGEIMMRDFADSRIINSDVNITVINSTNQSGLANFIGNRLEWAGYSVVSVVNSSDKIDNCKINYGVKANSGYGWQKLNELLKCQVSEDDNLNDNEIELYFGDGFASMVKYSNYNP